MVKINFEDLLVIVFIISLICDSAIGVKSFSKTKIKSAFSPLTTFSCYIFVFIMILCSLKGILVIQSVNPIRILAYLTKYIEYIIFFVLGGIAASSQKCRKLCIKAFLLGLILEIIWGIYSIITGHRAFVRGWRGEHGLYGIGLFSEPSTLTSGAIYVMCSIILLSFVRESFLSYIVNKFLLVLSIFSYFCAIFTGSRSSVVAGGIVFLFTLFRKYKLKSIFIIIFVLSIIVSIYPIALKHMFLLNRIIDASGYKISLLKRVQFIWPRDIAKLSEEPLLGWGPSIFASYGFPTEAHNAFLRTLVEFGLIGFCAFVGLLAVLIKEVYHGYKYSLSPNAYSCFYAAMGVIFVQVFISSVEDAFLPIKLNEFFWFIVGFLISWGNNTRSSSKFLVKRVAS